MKCRKMFDKNSMDSLVGPLIPEITVKYVAVFLIFFNSGLSLRTEVNKKCSHHSCAWRLKGYYLTFHFSQQEQLGAFFTYMSLIICFYFLLTGLSQGDYSSPASHVHTGFHFRTGPSSSLYSRQSTYIQSF